MKQRKNPGFVLMVVLALLLFFSGIIQKLTVSLLLQSRIMLDKKSRGYARALAYSFIPVSLVCLCKPSKEKNDKETDEKDDKKKLSPVGQFYMNLIRLSQEPKKIILEKKFDGIDAQVEFLIVSEEGKININYIYDFKKKELKPEYNFVLGKFLLEEGKEKIPLVDVLKEYFQKNTDKYPLVDIFCLKLKEHLPIISKLDKIGNKLVLSDLFTTYGEDKNINPILLSSTIAKGLKIEKRIFKGSEPDKNDKKEEENDEKNKLEEFCTKIDASLSSDWTKGIKTLETYLWKEQGDALSKDKKSMENLVSNLLSTEIEPKFFTVLIRVSYKSVEFSIAVVVEREDSIANLLKANELSSAKKGENKPMDGSDEKAEKAIVGRQNFYTIPGFKILRVYENFQ